MRPTYGAAGSAIAAGNSVRNLIWRGFYRWRIKSVSGGRIFTEESGGTALSKGDLVKADQLLWYEPTNNGQSNAGNELSMAVEFEAVWTRAYLLHTGEAALGISSGQVGGSVELNFVVYRHESPNTTTATYNTVPATYSSLFPNGTTDGITPFDGTLPAALATVQMADNAALSQPLKLEYLRMYGGGRVFRARGNSVTFGRGLQYSDADLGPIFRGLAIATLNGDFTGDNAPFVRFESGRFSTIELVGTRSSAEASQIESTSIFGNDYDRAIGDNTKLTITQEILGGRGSGFYFPNSAGNRNRKILDVTFKSGRHAVTREELSSVGYYSTNHSLYIGSDRGNTLNATYLGHRVLTVEGGRLADILGGRTGYDDNYRPSDGYPDILIRFKGGVSKGFIGGAAQHIRGGGDPTIICTGGTLNGYIAAGANATYTNKDVEPAYASDTTVYQTGDLFGDSRVYVGGNFHISMQGDTLLGSEAGSVYGSGCGFDYGDASLNMRRSRGEVDNSTVVVADNVVIERNIFGGGNMGNVKVGGTATIYITGGTIHGKVFGGGNRNKLTHGHVDILMKDGTVLGGVYGGSNHSGHCNGDIHVRILGGTVGYSGCSEEYGNVFGCGYGERTKISGDVRVTIGSEAGKATHSNNPLIHQSVYCGGHHAPHTIEDNTFSVKTWNGRIKNSVFGGGFGSTAIITGNTNVNIMGTTHVEGNVYGGGNMGKVKGNTRVVIGD